VAFAPDGQQLASGGWHAMVRLWDAVSGAKPRCLCAQGDKVESMDFTVQGQLFRCQMVIGDAQKGDGLEDKVESVAFSPDGRRLASGFKKGPVRLWDVETGECLELIQGIGDVAAIAAGHGFPWRAMNRGLETVVEESATGKPIAWFPVALDMITTHPSGRCWAGASGNHVYLLQFEGGDAWQVSNHARQIPASAVQVSAERGSLFAVRQTIAGFLRRIPLLSRFFPPGNDT
jgi:WD40 repeat protein